MKRLALALLVPLILGACSAALPALPRPPASGWKAHSEAGVTVRLPASWRVVDAGRLPDPGEIATLKAQGDPLAAYLETMSSDVRSGLYAFEALDPASVSNSVPFATSAYLAYIPGIAGQAQPSAPATPRRATPQELLAANLEATRSSHRLAALPRARAVAPPTGFEWAWEVEYRWEASQAGTGARAELAGLHYLLLRGEDAWILGFTSMLAAGTSALPTWRQVAGGLAAPALPLTLPLPVVVTLLALLALSAVSLLWWRRRLHHRRIEAEALERARRPRRWAR